MGDGAGETGLEKLVEGRSRQKKANARAQVPARGRSGAMLGGVWRACTACWEGDSSPEQGRGNGGAEV